MKFDTEFLAEGLYGKDTIVNEIIGRNRWSIQHRRVFKFDGKFYETFYSVGATECQEEHPYQYDPDVIECKEVFPQEITTTVYK